MSAAHLGVETEDAAELNLGEDFQHETCMSVAEVAVVLNRQLEESNANSEQNPVFQKTIAYVQKFSGIKDPRTDTASVSELRDSLSNYCVVREINGKSTEIKLEQFEIACLCNLNPEEVEEAIALIPSLHTKYREEEIDEILTILARSTARMFA